LSGLHLQWNRSAAKVSDTPCNWTRRMTYYDVPQEYGVREYRYTVVNDRPVLVDPRTRRIVEVVE
jgi:Protein of unknown function (DUF1236)